MQPAVALLVLAGCSYAFVTGPQASAPAQVDCTESYALPVVDDGVIAAAFGAASIAAFASHSTNNCNPNDSNQDFCVSGNVDPLLGALLIVPTVLYVLSAHHGASEISDCHDARTKQTAPRDLRAPS